MKRLKFLVLVGLLAFTLFFGIISDSIAQESLIPGKVFPLAKLLEDYNQIVSTIETQHPQFYTNKKELTELMKTQSELLKNNMNVLEFYRVLTPIVAKLNCGHTHLNLPDEFINSLYTQHVFLPMLVKVLHNKVYVYKDLSLSDIPSGSEIISINGRPASEIINVFLNNISADGSNTSKKYFDINQGFVRMYCCFIDVSPHFSLVYKSPTNSAISKTDMSAMNNEEYETAYRKAEISTKAHKDELYWYLFENDYALLTIKSFYFYENEPQKKFKAFIDEFFRNVSDKKATNLILDLRGNGGGDPYCSSYLYSYLISTESKYFTEDTFESDDLKKPLIPTKNNFNGNIFVLINGGCFSSTGHFCSLLKYHKIGTFIGEETGGSYQCGSYYKTTSLKNTKLKFRYATSVSKTAVEGLNPGRGIFPDYPVIPTIQDYLHDIDPEKQLAIELIKKQK